MAEATDLCVMLRQFSLVVLPRAASHWNPISALVSLSTTLRLPLENGIDFLAGQYLNNRDIEIEAAQ